MRPRVHRSKVWCDSLYLELWRETEGYVRIQPDLALVSSVLFTVALVSCVPGYLNATRETDDLVLQGAGFAFLTIICGGLLVTWMGFVRRIRWAWFAMAIIVWVWAFPVFVLPYLQHNIPITLREWVSDALRHRGPHRDSTEGFLVFAVMLIALTLPIKSFFEERDETASTRLEGVVR
jgi:energy-coupling factor transporter transmembrane protein EcfT